MKYYNTGVLDYTCWIGGICGINYSEIKNCITNVIGYGAADPDYDEVATVGGVTGDNTAEGSISNCLVMGSSTGTFYCYDGGDGSVGDITGVRKGTILNKKTLFKVRFNAGLKIY